LRPDLGGIDVIVEASRRAARRSRVRNGLVFLITTGLVGLVALARPHAQIAGGVEAQALPDLANRLEQARDTIRLYSEQLKAGLTEAVKASGFKGAVGACTSLAPDLNASISGQSPFEIGRTAMRVRNPDNTADPWEIANLEAFTRQLAAGGDHKKMEAYDVTVTKEGQRLFRYMRPIVMHEMCTGCHGINVSQDIKSEIARTYPDDKATGYAIGELRGAFTLVQDAD
jgi:Protein of unknown function (DUF3365)